MIDAIDALLDKMDLFLDAFGGSFRWFLYLCGALVAILVVMIVFMLGMRGKIARMSRQLAAQHEMLRRLLEAQLRQNRLTAKQMGKEPDPEDAPGQNPPAFKDLY